MKLDGVGAVVFRFSAVAFALKGLTGLVNMAWNYSSLARATQANPALREAFHQSIKNGLWSVFISLACGVVFWAMSRPLGRLLARDLDEPAEIKPVA